MRSEKSFVQAMFISISACYKPGGKISKKHVHDLVFLIIDGITKEQAKLVESVDRGGIFSLTTPVSHSHFKGIRFTPSGSSDDGV